MLLQVSTANEYIPNWNDNKENPEPIRIRHRTVTMALREQLVPKPKLRVHVNLKSPGAAENSQEEVSVGETDIVIDNRKIIEALVTDISGLRVPYKDKEISLSSPQDLFGDKAPTEVQGLIDELGVYFQKLLNARVEAKNS